jgi:hypothetical protein
MTGVSGGDGGITITLSKALLGDPSSTYPEAQPLMPAVVHNSNSTVAVP